MLIWKDYLGTNLACVAKESKTTVEENKMKIKAIMVGLVFSGALLLANNSQGLNNSDAMQQYIDTLNFNPLDPNLIKEIVKALSRLDNNIKMNDENIHSLDNSVFSIGSNLQAEIDTLKQEVAKLKKAKR
ncbi:hypothetical protein ACR9L4_07700 [Helicobacter pylori]